MSLSNLTASGWVLFAITAIVDLTFLTQLVLALRFKNRDITMWPYVPAILTVWLLYVVTP